MPDPAFWLLTAAVAAPALGALAVLLGYRSRMAGVAACGVSFFCLALLSSNDTAGSVTGWLAWDAFSALTALIFSGVALAVLLCAPVRDLSRRNISGMLCATAGALIAYLSANLITMFAGWLLSAASLLVAGSRALASDGLARSILARPTWMLGFSLGALVLAMLILALSHGAASLFTALPLLAPLTSSGAAAWVFGLLILAALIRNGIFPLHSWLISGFDGERTLLFVLVANAQLGACLIMKVALPLFPEISRAALTPISNLVLLSSLLLAFLAIGENRHKRILALASASQSGFLLSGLGSLNVEGITGALTQWLVVAGAATGLFIVYRLLEVRCGAVLRQGYAGLSARTPRLAAFFLVCALSLVGMPGTLGYCAEDLLLHGALKSHPPMGFALPGATALTAISLYRLFSRMFWGRPAHAVPDVADALPRERLVLATVALFLIVAGFAPHRLVSAIEHSAERIAIILQAPDR